MKKLLHLSYDYVLKHASNQMFKLEFSTVELSHGSMVKKLLDLIFVPVFLLAMKPLKFQPENYDFNLYKVVFMKRKLQIHQISKKNKSKPPVFL